MWPHSFQGRLRLPRRWQATSNQNNNDPDPSELVDFVLVFRYPVNPSSLSPSNSATRRTVVEDQESRSDLEQKALEAYQEVVGRLHKLGLEWYVPTETSQPGKLFIFVTCPDAVLKQWMVHGKVQDWLAGLRGVTTAGSSDATINEETDTGLAREDHPRNSPRHTVDSATPAIKLDHPLAPLLQNDGQTAPVISPAERLRLVYQRLTVRPEEGGAGLHPDVHPFIETLYPLHNKQFTRHWIKAWSTKWLINHHDLQRIREYLGEEIALYFAFLQFYFLWLVPPALVGLVWYLQGKTYSAPMALFVVCWAIAFVDMWARREIDIAVYWGTRHLGRVREPQPLFQPDGWSRHPITHELLPYFPLWKRWSRRMVTLPLIMAGAVFLAGVVGFLFALQTLTDEHYSGPGQAYVTYIPMILYSILMAKAGEMYTGLAKRLNNYENYPTRSEYEFHLTRKIFVLSFLINYLALIITAWAYIPFRAQVNHALLQFSTTILQGGIYGEVGDTLKGGKRRELGNDHVELKMSQTPADQLMVNQLFFFVMTGQILSLAQETIIPVATRYGAQWLQRRGTHNESSALGAKTGSTARSQSDSMSSSASNSDARMTSDKVAERGNGDDSGAVSTAESDKDTEEHPDGSSSSSSPAKIPPRLLRRLVKRALREYDLPEYLSYDDYSEMVTQFGFVVLFSIVWPLTPVIALVNNWIELRSDAVKICINVRRPIPQRAESIGPWLDNLKLLCWMASISNTLLVYQFGSLLTPTADTRLYGHTHLPTALGALLVTEHVFFGVWFFVRTLIQSFPSVADKMLALEDYRQKVGLSQAFSLTSVLGSTGSGQGNFTGTGVDSLENVVEEGSGRSSSRGLGIIRDDPGLQLISSAFKVA
ncbi:hypothetical protein IWQ61_008746 [Dispira simplex]|nr:hypothetical protein IWQ61_008746 [Dispira simplex]